MNWGFFCLTKVYFCYLKQGNDFSVVYNTLNAKSGIFFLCFLLSSFLGWSQHPDSLVLSKGKLYLYEVSDSTAVGYTSIQFDSLQNVHQRERVGALSIGNFGQPTLPLIYDGKRNLGFQWGLRPNLSTYSTSDLPYYHSNKPFTLGLAQIGSQSDEALHILHTQNIFPNWNIALSVNRHKSDGFYAHQESQRTRFGISSNFRSTNQRYQLFVRLGIEKYRNERNGGILADTLFTENLQPNRLVIPVAISTPYQERKSNLIEVVQYVNFGPSVLIPKDSLERMMVTPLFRIGLKQSYSNTRNRYRDDDLDTSFYSAFYIDSFRTNDKYQQLRYANAFRLEKIRTNNGFSLYAEGQQEYLELYQYDIRTNVLRNYSVEVGAGYTQDNLSAHVQWRSIFSGYNANDVMMEGQAAYKLGNVIERIQLKAYTQKMKPTLMDLQYAGNHDLWDNTFEQTTLTAVELEVRRNNRLRLNAGFKQIDEFVYYDTLALPAQDSVANTLLHVSLKQTIPFLKKMEFGYTAHLQSVNGSGHLRLPTVVAKATLAYNGAFFKGNLKTRFGVDATWFNEYDGYAYRTSSGAFYLQDGKKIGNYPTLDFFLNGRVKQVRFYVVLSHFNAGLNGFDYFAVPDYPRPDRAFRLGLEWKFIN